MYSCNACGARSNGGSHFCRECGAPLFAVTGPHSAIWGALSPVLVHAIPVGHWTRPPKSITLAVSLAAVFGPLGLLYSSVSGALYMLLGWWFLILATCDDWITDDVIFPMLVAWPICMIWAALAARTYNEDRR